MSGRTNQVQDDPPPSPRASATAREEAPTKKRNFDEVSAVRRSMIFSATPHDMLTIIRIRRRPRLFLPPELMPPTSPSTRMMAPVISSLKTSTCIAEWPTLRPSVTHSSPPTTTLTRSSLCDPTSTKLSASRRATMRRLPQS